MNKKVQITIGDDGIATLKMNDIERKNIFSDEFIADLMEGIDEIYACKPKVMILQGLSEVFSCGADKKQLLGLAKGQMHVKDLLISEKLVNAPFPIISAMEGHAIGGGLMLAACSDIVIAARESWYGVTFMTLGFTPGMGATTLLQDLFGSFLANEMMFTGKRYKGRHLNEMSTHINYILPKEEVVKKAYDIALQISQNNLESIHLLKYTLSARKKKLLIEARVQEDLMHRLSFSFPETKKRINDFYLGSSDDKN